MKKYITGICVTVVAVIAFIALMPLQAFFSSDDEIQKISDQEAVFINVSLPLAHEEKISSLQLSLMVTNKDGAPADAALLNQVKKLMFLPDQSVASTSEIVEQRYHEDTGILDIYVAGTTSLFSEENQLMLGSVAAELENGVDAYVKVADDSFKVVKGITLETMTDEQEAKVHISAAGEQDTPTEPSASEAPVNPTETVKPIESQEPVISQAPLPSQGADASQEPDASRKPDVSQEPLSSQEPGISQEPMGSSEPAGSQKPNVLPGTGDSINDASKLKSALEVAATYPESDYTADSYALLKKAVDNGKALLNNPNATQEALDKAADEIYNAIGMLVRLNKTSAGQTTATTTQDPVKSVSDAASTGDDNHLWLYAAMAALSLSAIGSVSFKKRRQKLSK